MSPGDEAQWRAALGGSAERYLKRFERIAAKGGGWVPGWNWAAFLHSTGWFWYRRMYAWALCNLVALWALLFGVLLLAGLIEPRINLDALALSIVLVYLICVFILVPLFADAFYFRYLAARVPQAKPPSTWTKTGAVVLALVWCIPLSSVAHSSYGDYTPRAKVSEGIMAAASVRTGVTEFYAQHQRFPDAAEGARIAGDPVSKRVQSIVWDPGQRAIVVTMREPFPGKRFALRFVEQDGQLMVKCGPIDLDKKHLPGSCRD